MPASPLVPPRGSAPNRLQGINLRGGPNAPGTFNSQLYQPESGGAGQAFGVRLKDPPTGHLPIAVVGDILNIKAVTNTGVVENWWRVNSVTDPGSSAGFYYYNVTRMSGSPATFPAGAAVANWGQSGQGVISLSTDGSIGSQPNISILTHSGQPWNSTTLLSRWGNLNGSYGINANTIGIGIGDYSGGNYLRYDNVSGTFKIVGGNNNVQIDPNGISLLYGNGSYNAITWYDTFGGTASSTIQGQLGALFIRPGNGNDLVIGDQLHAQPVINLQAALNYVYINSGIGGTLAGLTIGSTGSPNAMLDVRGSAIVTNASGAPTLKAIYGGGTTAGFAPTFASGFRVVADTSVTAADFLTGSVTLNIKNANANSTQGFEVYLAASHTSGVLNSVPVLFGTFENSAAGTVTDASGVSGGLVMGNGSGNLTNFKALYANSVAIGTPGTVANYYGLYIDTFSSNITNKWGIYQADANGKNLIAGGLNLGTGTGATTGQIVIDGNSGTAIATTGNNFTKGNVVLGLDVGEKAKISIFCIPGTDVGARQEGIYVNVSPSVTQTGGDVDGMYIFANPSYSGAGSNINGLYFQAAKSGAGSIGTVCGVQGAATNDGAGNITQINANYLTVSSTGASSISDMRGIYVTASISAGTATNFTGIRIATPSISGTGAITNAYGLYIEAVSGAGTLNYALYTNAGLVHFGDSVDLASGKNLTLLAGNIATDSTTGTKIGTATSQKIGLWNATPIVQPTTGVAAATFTANSGTAVNDASTFDGYTLKQVVKALRNIGLLA